MLPKIQINRITLTDVATFTGINGDTFEATATYAVDFLNTLAAHSILALILDYTSVAELLTQCREFAERGDAKIELLALTSVPVPTAL